MCGVLQITRSLVWQAPLLLGCGCSPFWLGLFRDNHYCYRQHSSGVLGWCCDCSLCHTLHYNHKPSRVNPRVSTPSTVILTLLSPSERWLFDPSRRVSLQSHRTRPLCPCWLPLLSVAPPVEKLDEPVHLDMPDPCRAVLTLPPVLWHPPAVAF